METRLWTVHRKGDRGLTLISDGFSIFALIVPVIWVIWHGMWLTLAALIVVLGVTGLLHPLAAGPVMYGLGFIFAFDGAALRRFELGLWGWEEVAVVEARSEEGAEEMWLRENAPAPVSQSPWTRPPAHPVSETTA